MNQFGFPQDFVIDLQTKLRNFKQEFAMEFQKRVEDRTPVLTGALKAGWVTEQTVTGFTLNNVQPYAEYVENGTDKMAPRAMVATTVLEIDQMVDLVAKKVGLK